ncbi:peptidoglycan-binding domain-containing protein, partial [Inquilinus limosus]
LVPPPRPAEAAPQVADIGPADQQQPIVPETSAPHGEAAQTPPAAPAAAAPVQATQPPARPTDSRTGRIQAALARRGFYAGSPSGRMDGRTREAIRAFQASIGDPSSGVLTQIQIAKLLNLGP